jgi:hypothetical protein
MMRIDINGSWEPEDFIDVLTGIESLYYKALSDDEYRSIIYWPDRPLYMTYSEQIDLSNHWFLAQARMTTRRDLRLKVSRIEYASPGGMDLLGLGKACKAVEGIVDRLIRFFTEAHIRQERDKQETLETTLKEIEVEKKRESLRELKIKNARSLLELRKKYPEFAEELFVAMAVRDQDLIFSRIAEGKITSSSSVLE